MATDYKVGDKIVLFKRHQEAIIRYIGKTKFAPNTRSFGLELIENGNGDNNGTVNGIEYFECPKNKGLFVWEKDIKFKIQPRKRSIKNIKSPRKASTPISVNDIYSMNVRTPTLTEKNSKISFSRKSIKKLGPRDVGRNHNYKGIEDEPISPKSFKKKKKSKKKKNKTNGENKSKRKQSMKTDEKPTKKKKIKTKKKTVDETKSVETASKEIDADYHDSDSYKSGYSGASGHSQYSLSGHYVDDEIDDGLVIISQDDMDRNDITTDGMNDSEDLLDSYDDKDSDDDDKKEEEREDMEHDEEQGLMQKVMLMMKQKEEEKEEKEREREIEEQKNMEMDDKIVLVAMSHKQMNENNEQLSLFEDDDDEEPTPHQIGGDIVQNTDDNDDGNDDDDDNDDKKEMIEDAEKTRDDGEEKEMEGDIVNDDKKDEYNSDIDDDLPPPNRADLELKEEGSARLKSYAKRKGSEHDKALDQNDDIKSEEELDAMRMASIYKRLSMKSMDTNKGNDVKRDTNQMYMDIGKMTMDWNKKEEAEEEEEEEEETDKEGKTKNVDEEPIAPQQNGCCVVL